MKLTQNNWKKILDRIRANDLSLIELELDSYLLDSTRFQELIEALKINNILTHLDLSNNDIGDVGVKALSKILKTNQAIKTLILMNDSISAIGARVLAKVLKINQTLTDITLHSQIGDAGAQALAEALKINQTIMTVSLIGCEISNVGVKALAEVLKINQTIEILDLQNNQIGSAGTQALAEVLKTNQIVKKLVLGGNQIGDAGVKALAEMLKINQSITSIDCRDMNVTDAGAQFLAESLKTNQTLVCVGFSYFGSSSNKNKISDVGAQAIIAALKNNQSLTELDLSYAEIGDTGAQAMAELLRINQNLARIELTGNKIGDTGKQAIAKALETNQSITKFSCGSAGFFGSGNVSEATKNIDSYINRNEQLRNALHKAVKKNRLKRVKELIDEKVSLYSVIEDGGNTPLHQAVLKNLPDMTALLIREMQAKNISLGIRNWKGQTALDIAKKENKPALIKLLTNASHPPLVQTNPASSIQGVPLQEVKTAPAALVTTTPSSHLAFNFAVDYSQLKLGRELGRGGYGVVYQGIYRSNPVAIKQLHLGDPSEASLAEFKAEMQVMAGLRAPQIIQFYGVYFTPSYGIVMEYMPMGSLYSVLKSNRPLGWDIRYNIAKDIALGLAFLHAEHIYHRDMKSLNVLLDEHYRAKLTDFGLAKIKHESTSISTTGKQVGTLRWMAPEIMDEEKYTDKADTYSCAVTFWELATREIPFKDKSDPFVMRQVTTGKRLEQQPIPADCPKQVAELIRQCWMMDPAKRPSSSEIVTVLTTQEEPVQSTTTTISSYRGNLDSFNPRLG